jgi:hypothetical protein
MIYRVYVRTGPREKVLESEDAADLVWGQQIYVKEATRLVIPGLLQQVN